VNLNAVAVNDLWQSRDPPEIDGDESSPLESAHTCPTTNTCARTAAIALNRSGNSLTSSCGGVIEQVISAPAVQFKGSGWYVTDYAKKGAASAGSSSSSSAEDESGKKESKESKDAKETKDSKKDDKPKSDTSQKKQKKN
jgi:predicted nucleic acid-binding Zn ribbon protein